MSLRSASAYARSDTADMAKACAASSRLDADGLVLHHRRAHCSRVLVHSAAMRRTGAHRGVGGGQREAAGVERHERASSPRPFLHSRPPSAGARRELEQPVLDAAVARELAALDDLEAGVARSTTNAEMRGPGSRRPATACGEHHEHVGHGPVRAPEFLAVQHPAAAGAVRARLQARGSLPASGAP